MSNYLLAKNPYEPDFEYILRMDPPVTLIGVLNMDKTGPVVKHVSKDYSRVEEGKNAEIFQLVAMPFNDGISEFNLSTIEELEWVLDDAWKWYDTIPDEKR